MFLAALFLIAPFVPAVAADAPAPPYVSRSQLAVSGYATPESAFETLMWALIYGKYQNYVNSFAQESQADLLKIDKKKFFNDAKRALPEFKGYQIVAEKKLSDDEVDLKFFIENTDVRRTFPLANGTYSDFGLQSMVKAGGEWRASGNFRGYDTNWDDASVINFAKP